MNQKKNEELYNEAIEIFHPFDGTFIEFLNVHNYEQIEMKNYAKCLDIAEIKLVHLHQHLQEYDMSIGDQAIEAAKWCTHLDLWDEAEGYVIKAKDIFEVMFGKDYPLLTQKWKPIQIQIDQHKTTS